MRVAVIILAIIGMLVSGYSWYGHYSDSTETFCDISTTFSCSTVNKSIYSEFLGIPVAAIGFFGYTVILLLALSQQPMWRYVLAAGILGIAFSLYLTYLEFAVLKAYCILCLISQTDILAITVLAGANHRKGSARP